MAASVEGDAARRRNASSRHAAAGLGAQPPAGATSGDDLAARIQSMAAAFNDLAQMVSSSPDPAVEQTRVVLKGIENLDAKLERLTRVVMTVAEGRPAQPPASQPPADVSREVQALERTKESVAVMAMNIQDAIDRSSARLAEQLAAVPHPAAPAHAERASGRAASLAAVSALLGLAVGIVVGSVLARVV